MAWGLAGLTVAVVLAGCASSSPEPSTADAGTSVITDPRDTAYLQDGSTTAGSHIHDYWGGRDRVEVLNSSSSTHSVCSGGCSGGFTTAIRRPSEGAIVPQGTKWVNGTFSFTPDGPQDYSGLELWVKTAKDSDRARVGPLEPGVPFSLQSTQEKNDPPHYVLSLWEFSVHVDGDSTIEIKGDYTWTVEAVRGLPLVAYPPHPDRWEGKTELLLLEDQAAAVLYTEDQSSTSCYLGAPCPGTHSLPDGIVVPFDTSRVEVRLGGVSPVLGVRYHGSDTWNTTLLEGRQDGADRLFVIAPEGSADSPYAQQSLWEFRVTVEESPPAGPEVWSGAYTITVRAFKD